MINGKAGPLDTRPITVDVPWDSYLNTNGTVEVIGNDSNRFDAASQDNTLGPQPPVPDVAPPETDGIPLTSSKGAADPLD